MKIVELFSRDIGRKIEEVIKVDDETTILTEIEEYHPTDHIEDELVDVLNAYQETINTPSENTNIWVSGFFGSGKSSFAKVLGYLLANPSIDGTRVADRFFELNEIPQAQALLNTIHAQAKTDAVLLDLGTSPNVLKDGEPIVLPVYRTVLDVLGYSRDVTLAELEYALEGSDDEIDLATFIKRYEDVHGRRWEDDRDVITAKNRASRILHELDPDTYPSADSWSNAVESPEINANWFADRAIELLARRRPQSKRLVLIVDEVGQYVARSTERMLHLQGLAEACQKRRGALWLLATSQEKLTDVVDSLEGKQTELAKAQDRFPIKVDLLPSDIDEVTGKRVLDKNASGIQAVRDALANDRHKLTTSVTLQSDRHRHFTDEDFVRLYPLVPYQLQLLIDAVSARRAQGGSLQTMGGSNRTIIKHTQQLITHSAVGLAENQVGDLVTLNRSYTLLEEVIPTAWRHEVDQVVAAHGEQSVEAKIMQVVALCTDVPGVPLTARNLAVLLHPSTNSDPIELAVREALERLVAEDRVREGDDGYRLQSPEEKDWEKTRRGIDMKPGEAVRLRRQILRDALGSLTVARGRTFKVELTAEREKVSDGDIRLDVREDNDLDALRTTSRSEDSKNRIFWAYEVGNETWDALAELHRSIEMIDRHDNAGQTDAQRVLLGEERKRSDRARRKAEKLLSHDLGAGSIVFDGNTYEIPDGELRSTAEKVVAGRLDNIYPNLDVFSTSFKRTEVIQILRADSLEGLPDQCGSEGLGIVRLTPGGPELVTDSGPIEIVVSRIEARKQYGEDQNGIQLERHFGGPGYGALTETIQAVLAAAMRAGLIEVVSQAARITSATDRRLDEVFQKLPKFRAASFRSAEDVGPPLQVRADVAEFLHGLTGESVGLDIQALAERTRSSFGPLRHPCTEARSMLRGAGLAVPGLLTTMDEILGRISGGDDDLVVETMHERKADLADARQGVEKLAELIENEMGALTSASQAVDAAETVGDPKVVARAEKLQELLDRAHYADDLGQIKSATSAIEQAVIEAEKSAADDLAVHVEGAMETLRARYPAVPDDTFADATGVISSLTETRGLALLLANVRAVDGAVRAATELLDAVSTTREVRHVRVTEVWGSAITSEAELTAALARLREAVLAELEDGTEVRLR